MNTNFLCIEMNTNFLCVEMNTNFFYVHAPQAVLYAIEYRVLCINLSIMVIIMIFWLALYFSGSVWRPKLLSEFIDYHCEVMAGHTIPTLWNAAVMS